MFAVAAHNALAVIALEDDSRCPVIQSRFQILVILFLQDLR